MTRGLVLFALLVLSCSSGSGTAPPACQSSSISESEIQAVCQKASAASCVDTTSYDECVSDVHAAVTEFASGCCGARLGELLRCGIKNGFRCSSFSDDTLFTPACAASEEAFDECSGSGDNCTLSIGQSASTIGCDQYAATCENGVCTCVFGPHVGKTFPQTGATYEEAIAIVASACK